MRLDELNPKYQAQVVAQIHGKPKGLDLAGYLVAEAKTDEKRIRQKNGDGMNKTERAFFVHLKATFPDAAHFPQRLSLRLANGASYRPDFISVFTLSPDTESDSIRLTAWETKGFMREAAAVRIKVAASLYPWIAFCLVTKKKGGGWKVERILP